MKFLEKLEKQCIFCRNNLNGTIGPYIRDFQESTVNPDYSSSLEALHDIQKNGGNILVTTKYKDRTLDHTVLRPELFPTMEDLLHFSGTTTSDFSISFLNKKGEEITHLDAPFQYQWPFPLYF